MFWRIKAVLKTIGKHFETEVKSPGNADAEVLTLAALPFPHPLCFVSTLGTSFSGLPWGNATERAFVSCYPV